MFDQLTPRELNTLRGKLNSAAAQFFTEAGHLIDTGDYWAREWYGFTGEQYMNVGIEMSQIVIGTYPA